MEEIRELKKELKKYKLIICPKFKVDDTAYTRICGECYRCIIRKIHISYYSKVNKPILEYLVEIEDHNGFKLSRLESELFKNKTEYNKYYNQK